MFSGDSLHDRGVHSSGKNRFGFGFHPKQSSFKLHLFVFWSYFAVIALIRSVSESRDVVKAHPVMHCQHCLCVQKHAEWLLSQLTAHVSAKTKHPASQRAECRAVGLHHASLWGFFISAGRAGVNTSSVPLQLLINQIVAFSLQIHANLSIFCRLLKTNN